MNALYRPCPNCLPVIEAGMKFQAMLRQYDAIELQAEVFHDSKAPPVKINVNTLAIRCLKCKGTQEVLTKEGEKILKLLKTAHEGEIVPRFGIHVEPDPDWTKGERGDE